jgi:hypothetical protein
LALHCQPLLLFLGGLEKFCCFNSFIRMGRRIACDEGRIEGTIAETKKQWGCSLTLRSSFAASFAAALSAASFAATSSAFFCASFASASARRDASLSSLAAALAAESSTLGAALLGADDFVMSPPEVAAS